jgi:tetratricopeptide (TPR) repeat protein
MFEAPEIDFLTTDGEIAVINLESARRRSWSRFFHDPLREGIAEIAIEHEQLAAQFLGDVSALDRLEALVRQLVQTGDASPRTALIQAQVASMTHRFADARQYLARAHFRGTPPPDIKRLRLNIDQARGVNLDRVLDQRREIARKSGRLEDLVALGSLLGDLREFPEADHVYRQALRGHRDVSPFPVAWVCFQLGALWGELVPEPQATHAAQWYRRAINCLPSYTKARVHLAEIYSSCGRIDDAQALLVPAISSGDPEVRWRLADALSSHGKSADAEAHMQAARSGFESLLERHMLAFADHGAAFYAGSGDDCVRALQLARINVANRPTLRAFEQAHSIALSAADVGIASGLLAEATERWGGSAAFQSSPLAKHSSGQLEGAPA